MRITIALVSYIIVALSHSSRPRFSSLRLVSHLCVSYPSSRPLRLVSHLVFDIAIRRPASSTSSHIDAILPRARSRHPQIRTRTSWIKRRNPIDLPPPSQPEHGKQDATATTSHDDKRTPSPPPTPPRPTRAATRHESDTTRQDEKNNETKNETRHETEK